jgi:CBS domain-containing protein
MRIGEILARKSGPDVVTIAPDQSVRALLDILAEHNIGACVVSTDGSSVAGIVSERDVVRRLHADPDTLDGPVSAIMTSVVETCDVEAAADDLMGVMTRRRIRHVPVLREGELVGVVSIGDLVKHRIDELTFERDQLDAYVHQS